MQLSYLGEQAVLVDAFDGAEGSGGREQRIHPVTIQPTMQFSMMPQLCTRITNTRHHTPHTTPNNALTHTHAPVSLNDSPEVRRIGSAHWLSLVQQRGASSEQRTVHRVRVTHHPAHVTAYINNNKCIGCESVSGGGAVL